MTMAGRVTKRARHRDTLLLAAGELIRLVLQPVAQAYEVEDFFGALGGATFMLAGVEGNLDVLLRGERRDEVERLVDHTDLLIAHLCQPGLAHRGDVDAVNQHLATGRVVQSGDDAEQRRLARPRRADDGDELAMLDAQADALEDINAITSQPERLANVNAFERRDAFWSLRARLSLFHSLRHVVMYPLLRVCEAGQSPCLSSIRDIIGASSWNMARSRHSTYVAATVVLYVWKNSRGALWRHGLASARHPRSGNERPSRH